MNSIHVHADLRETHDKSRLGVSLGTGTGSLAGSGSYSRVRVRRGITSDARSARVHKGERSTVEANLAWRRSELSTHTLRKATADTGIFTI
jgi:hypothetical protein